MKSIRYDSLVDFSFQDQRSIDVFNMIYDYKVFRDEIRLVERISELGGRWRCFEIERALRAAGTDKVCIYGAGFDGKINKKVLDMCGIPVECIYDSNPSLKGGSIGDTAIAYRDDLLKKTDDDSVVVISSKTYWHEIREDLAAHGVPEKRILIPEHGNLFAWSQDQYFDVFDPGEDEVFVDGGSYNGDTAKQFTRWCADRYRKIYLIEPGEDGMRQISARFGNNRKAELVKCALWDKTATLSIFMDEDSSSVSESAEYMTDRHALIEGKKLDDIVGEERVTFIKLDVEGSELEALRGAEKTIKRCHPRIAVSVYHKERDLIDIPEYIIMNYPEYRLWLRHYSSSALETVLYASI